MEGEGDEGTRTGMRMQLSALGATGIAPVQAVPTTAAQWLIVNPAANTKSAYIDELGMILVSGTGGANATVLCAVLPPANMPATVPSASAANIVITNRSTSSGNTSRLIVASAQTLVGVTAGWWYPLAWEDIANTLLGQTQLVDRDIRGKIEIAPGGGVALAVISPTGTTPLWGPVGTWREYESDNE
jgi:hypothetical protein